MCKLLSVILMLLVMGSFTLVWADGVPLTKDGRYAGTGGATVLDLTAKQTERLVKLGKDYVGVDITLTSMQKKMIEKARGFSPSSVVVYNSRKGENTCTCPCHAVNPAYWFSDTQIEVPHAYLMTDAAAKECDRELEGQ